MARKDFEKDFFLLMNNAKLDKTMNILLVTNRKSAPELIAKLKTKTVFNNHIYLGLAILYLSKTLMMNFVYVYLKPKYSSHAKMYAFKILHGKCNREKGIKRNVFNNEISFKDYRAFVLKTQ